MPVGVGLAFVIIVVAIIALAVFFYFVPVRLWIEAVTSGAHVGIMSLVGMRLRKVPPPIIVRQRISLTKAGIGITTDQLEAHYLAGGNVPLVVKALISADKANIALPFKRAAAIDLAGRAEEQQQHCQKQPTAPSEALCSEGVGHAAAPPSRPTGSPPRGRTTYRMLMLYFQLPW